MWKKALFGLAVPVLALAGFAASQTTSAKSEEPRVICCGECKPGDDCLAKCEVVDKAPKDLKLTCGSCQKGDDCLKECGPAKGSYCEAK